MVRNLLVLILVGTLSLILVACGGQTEKATNSPNRVLIDVNQFSRISTDELVKIMGKPDKIEGYAGISPKTKEKISGQVYIYQKKYEFIIFDNKVARMNIYSDKYYDNNKPAISFQNEKEIFSMFGIVPSKNLKKVADTGYALRYQLVSDKVADVWILDIDKNKTTFNIGKITYDLNYLQ